MSEVRRNTPDLGALHEAAKEAIYEASIAGVPERLLSDTMVPIRRSHLSYDGSVTVSANNTSLTQHNDGRITAYLEKKDPKNTVKYTGNIRDAGAPFPHDSARYSDIYPLIGDGYVTVVRDKPSWDGYEDQDRKVLKGKNAVRETEVIATLAINAIRTATEDYVASQQ